MAWQHQFNGTEGKIKAKQNHLNLLPEYRCRSSFPLQQTSDSQLPSMQSLLKTPAQLLMQFENRKLITTTGITHYALKIGP